MEFRAEGVAGIADAIDQGGNGSADTKAIASRMQDFLTSDVLYIQRAVERMKATLKDKGLGESITASQYLPSVDWLQPDYVASQVGSGGSGKSGDAAPGLHGDGLGTVTLGGQERSADGATEVPLADDLSLRRPGAEPGREHETNVNVTVTVGSGGDARNREDDRHDRRRRDEAVAVPLDEKPPTGQNVPIKVGSRRSRAKRRPTTTGGEFTVIFTC